MREMARWSAGAAWLAGSGLGLALLAGCGGQTTVSYGTITTYAGNGTHGYSGDGGAATSATLDNPGCVALDAAGNLFTADAARHVVRRVSAAGGISTVAGTGVAGYAGDGGPANAAQLNAPNGCAVDAAGNLYIADTGNNVIRKVTTSTGVITTVAGTGYAGFSGDGAPPILADMNHPYAVAVDGAGNLYISDTQNFRVRKVTVAANTITTVAGNGTYGYTGDGKAATDAQLYNPEGLAVTSGGDLIFAEEASSVVRKVTASTGVISTVAGNGSYGFLGNGKKATFAELNRPTSVAVDGAGLVYFTDAGNAQVRRVTADGNIETVVGTDTAGYKGDGKAATDAQLSNPRAVAFNASGVMFIADTNNGVVRRVAP